MRVFNEDKTAEILEYDLEKGYLKADKLFIAHHEALEARSEEGHYKLLRTYPNGGRELKWVVDVPAVTAREAYDEYEDIQVYIPYTEDYLAVISAKKEIAQLKQRLAETDYQAIKYAEGVLSPDDYASMKEQRQRWRDRINELEGKYI